MSLRQVDDDNGSPFHEPIPQSHKYICAGPLRSHIESFLEASVQEGYSRRSVREKRIFVVS
jgi:hypothetical protein